MKTHVHGTDTEVQADKKPAPLFPQYQPSARHAAQAIRNTQQAGWLTVALAALMLWAQPEGYPPGYWVVMGTALGASLILLGALELRHEGTHRTRLATSMSANLEQWFPYLLFGLQTLFMFLIVAVMWFTLPSLGVPLHPLLHTGLFIFLALITVRRFISEWAQHKNVSVRLPVQDALQAFTIIIVALLVAIALTHAVSPFGHPITGDNTILVVLIWVVAGFVILCGLALFADKIFKRKSGR